MLVINGMTEEEYWGRDIYAKEPEQQHDRSLSGLLERVKKVPYELAGRMQVGAIALKERVATNIEKRDIVAQGALGAAAVGAVYVATKSGQGAEAAEYGTPAAGFAWLKRRNLRPGRRNDTTVGAATETELHNMRRERRRRRGKKVAVFAGAVAVAWVASKIGVYDIDMGKNTDGGFFELNIPSGGDENTIDRLEGTIHDKPNGLDEEALERRIEEFGNEIEQGAQNIEEGVEDATEEVDPGPDRQDPEEVTVPVPTPESTEGAPIDESSSQEEEAASSGTDNQAAEPAQVQIRLDELSNRADSIWGSSEYQLAAHDAPVNNRSVGLLTEAFQEKYGISEAEARQLHVGWRGTLEGSEIPRAIRKYFR